MTFSARRRVMAGVLVGAAFALVGCTVPGQPAPAGAAAEYDGVTISNARISELYEVWRDEADQSASRKSVVTLELLREPLLAAAEDLDLPYNRSLAEQQAGVLLQIQGLEPEPTDDLIDAVESAYLVAAFATSADLAEPLEAAVAQVEADAVTNARTGDFSAQALNESVAVSMEQASSLSEQGMPAWFVAFRNVNGFTNSDAEWLATQSATTQ